ncbi:MAG: hypothetical protein AAFR93_04905 [Pseudomonadota bacterium]
METLEQFGQSVCDAFVTGRLEAHHQRYELPVIMIRSKDTLRFDKISQLQRYSNTVRELYLQKGLASMTFSVVDQIRFDPGVAIASFAWDYLDAEDQVINRLFTTYVLRPTQTQFKIASHISHNEYVDRPAIEASIRQDATEADGPHPHPLGPYGG